MFEQTFNNLDNVLRQEAGCTTELDYTEQTSWMLFLKYLDDLEEERSLEAQLNGKAYFVPISPHNANGSLQIVSGIHVMMTVPNFYRLEHCVSFIPTYNSFLKGPIIFDRGRASISGKPGLGHDLDMDTVTANLHPDWTS